MPTKDLPEKSPNNHEPPKANFDRDFTDFTDENWNNWTVGPNGHADNLKVVREGNNWALNNQGRSDVGTLLRKTAKNLQPRQCYKFSIKAKQTSPDNREVVLALLAAHTSISGPVKIASEDWTSLAGVFKAEETSIKLDVFSHISYGFQDFLIDDLEIVALED
jgi:hypothetical protein